MLAHFDFQYYLVAGSHPEKSNELVYRRTYDVWREVWQTAFQELKVDKPFFSDSFTRQDYIGSLFYRNECIAMCFYRFVDAQKADFSKDSYFFNWSQENLNKLRSRGDKIIVCSYFTVHPRGRGSALGFSGKDLLMGITTKTFLESNYDAMTGAVRVNRGVNTAGERWGTTLIESNVASGMGDTVDLIACFHDEMRIHRQHPLVPLVDEIWNNVILCERKMDLPFNISSIRKELHAAS